MNTICIKGIDKAALLANLYNAAGPNGMGLLHHTLAPMTLARAQELVALRQHFEYLNGRALKIDLRGDTLETALYDRDNGTGAARHAIAHLLPVNA